MVLYDILITPLKEKLCKSFDLKNKMHSLLMLPTFVNNYNKDILILTIILNHINVLNEEVVQLENEGFRTMK